MQLIYNAKQKLKGIYSDYLEKQKYGIETRLHSPLIQCWLSLLMLNDT